MFTSFPQCKGLLKSQKSKRSFQVYKREFSFLSSVTIRKAFTLTRTLWRKNLLVTGFSFRDWHQLDNYIQENKRRKTAPFFDSNDLSKFVMQRGTFLGEAQFSSRDETFSDLIAKLKQDYECKCKIRMWNWRFRLKFSTRFSENENLRSMTSQDAILKVSTLTSGKDYLGFFSSGKLPSCDLHFTGVRRTTWFRTRLSSLCQNAIFNPRLSRNCDE